MVMQADLTYGHADIQRFWSKVAKGDGCWIWTGTLDKHGYGAFKVGGKMIGAHRFALILSGENIDGLFGCHGCDNPPCVRVGDGHVFVGTPLDNTRDMDAKGRGVRAGKGAANRNSKLTEGQVNEIIERYRNGERQLSIAAMYGIGQMEVSRIVRGTRWGHVGGSGEIVRQRGKSRTKLTDELIAKAKSLRGDGATYQQIALDCNVSLTMAWNMINKR